MCSFEGDLDIIKEKEEKRKIRTTENSSHLYSEEQGDKRNEMIKDEKIKRLSSNGKVQNCSMMLSVVRNDGGQIIMAGC